ncbi:MAG: hypothetical protein JSU79_03930, partial [Dehalococcoidales bacterium]
PGIHSKVIHYELANEIGLNVVKDDEMKEVWDAMRTWLRQYLYNPAGTNFIKFVIPQYSTMNSGERRSYDASHQETNETREENNDRD